jgi:Zn-dependent protease
MRVASAIGILFSIVFHELSPALVWRRFGVKVNGVTLFIFGGVAELKGEPVSPKAEVLMAVAGPLASRLPAFLFSRVEVLATARCWPRPLIGVSHKPGPCGVQPAAGLPASRQPDGACRRT